MAKWKAANLFSLASSSDVEQKLQALAQQVAKMTDSLVPMFQSGVTVADNLNMEYKEVRIQSGLVAQLSTSVSRPKGARVVATGGLKITKESSKVLSNNTVEVVVEYEGTGLNPMTFIIYGE